MEWFTDHGVRDSTVLNFFVRFWANGDMHSNCLFIEGWEVCDNTWRGTAIAHISSTTEI